MSQNTNTENGVNRFFSFLALIYTVLTAGNILLNFAGTAFGIQELSGLISLSTLAVPFATILVFYLCLYSLGENAYKGALLILIPTFTAAAAGFVFNATSTSVYTLFGFLAPTAAGAVVYCVSKKSGLCSNACAAASFTLLAFDILQAATAVIAVCAEKKLSFNTVVFEGISTFTDEIAAMYNGVYTEALNSVSKMYGPDAVSQIDLSMYAIDTAYLKELLISTIALTPAIMCAAYFFMIYLFTRIADPICTALGLCEKKVFGKFSITSVTSAFFSICAFVFVFSILFESEMSAFTCGIFSSLIVLLPNYIILGIRRLVTKFSRVMPKGVAILLLLGIIFTGLFVSPYLLILVIVFFGTSEHKASKSDGTSGN